MASKLRRTPLFGYDGNLGIPIISTSKASSSTPTTSAAAASSKVGRLEVRRRTLVAGVVKVCFRLGSKKQLLCGSSSGLYSVAIFGTKRLTMGEAVHSEKKSRNLNLTNAIFPTRETFKGYAVVFRRFPRLEMRNPARDEQFSCLKCLTFVQNTTWS